MAAKKNIILITGGNGSIGFELASQLLAEPSNNALIASRSAKKGNAAIEDLQSRKRPGTVELLRVDVASEESMSVAAKEVENGLVNNAAIADVSTNGTPGQKMSQTFATNTTGPLLMVDAFAPLLKKSLDIARVVNVTSGAGSISMDLDPQAMGYAMKTVEYRASKAVLNMISACQAVEHGREELKLFLFNPEFTVSSLGPYDKKEYGAKPTSEGAEPVVKILRGKREKDHGGFLHANGQHPWIETTVQERKATCLVQEKSTKMTNSGTQTKVVEVIAEAVLQ